MLAFGKRESCMATVKYIHTMSLHFMLTAKRRAHFALKLVMQFHERSLARIYWSFAATHTRTVYFFYFSPYTTYVRMKCGGTEHLSIEKAIEYGRSLPSKSRYSARIPSLARNILITIISSQATFLTWSCPYSSNCKTVDPAAPRS